ncbi:MAG: hypothetical protein A2087_01370 [Spirochaetes bacterium GWD1_61_31]|nr:MAG: hypothetical protein A2004_10740 [Spirochaetes bacterium GWC1_61_12]OHD36772.1 MAG: hypothetical protein A2087_01370 [Spirochaetes bacterium GWD1_61_31]
MVKRLWSTKNSHRLLVVGATLVCLVVFMVFSALSSYSAGELFEVGKVADRDIVAESDVVYVDEAATAMRVDEARRQVSPVFVLDDGITAAVLNEFSAFDDFFQENRALYPDNGAFLIALQVPYAASVGAELLERLLDYQSPANLFNQTRLALADLLSRGIFSIPDSGLEPYNPLQVELRKWVNGSLVYEQLDLESLATVYQLDEPLAAALRRQGAAGSLATLAGDLVQAFIEANAFFDQALSQRRLDTAGSGVEPVMRRLSKGERIIRKGFVVTEQDMLRLNALQNTAARFSLGYALGGGFFILLLFLAGIFFLSGQMSGITLNDRAFRLVLALAMAYFLLSAVLAALLPLNLQPHLAALLPGTLFAMLLALLFNDRFAIFFSLVLSLSLLPVSGFNAFLFTQSLIAGCAGALLVRRTSKRIDLVRAGAQLALIQFGSAIALGSLFGNNLQASLTSAIGLSLNAFFCSTLTLAFLPLLEQFLNAATAFRLQELSDLNAPALKMLLSVAPGTYSHSVSVAHLAESACREIGASPLLARVGAYYHDIGKIEQAEYFIENQSGYNKHDEINPRLSATVLRSHVKFGVERADSLGLPHEIRDIMASHHGNSVISFFYNKANREDAEASQQDYRYPGPLPASREAAVVMLADCAEAASRSLKRPTMPRLEQFVQDLINERLADGQLANSALTFHDLEQIKNTFVRILASHFHSRIEYPKAKENGK